MMSSMIVYNGQEEKCDRKYSGNKLGFSSCNAIAYGWRHGKGKVAAELGKRIEIDVVKEKER